MSDEEYIAHCASRLPPGHWRRRIQKGLERMQAAADTLAAEQARLAKRPQQQRVKTERLRRV